MAKFKPYKILESQLDSLPIKEGQFILTTDTKKLYSDTAANTRILISPDAITDLSVNGTTITYTRLNGTTGTITTKDTTYSVASETKNGLMSSDDKAKLNAIESGAQKNTVTGIKGDSETLYRTGNVNITKSNIGLSNVENKSSATIRGELTSSNVTTALGYTPLNSNLKGANNGLAELDASGKVPTSQLPSYVDDVLEYSAKANFPTTGETGKIYVDTTTNKTYRWGGSAYVEISPSIALGTTSSTAFRGDYGQAAYTHAVTNKGSKFDSGLYKITTNAEGHVTGATAVVKGDITALGIPAQDTTYSAATTGAAGLMSAADKTKLDGIAAGAQKNTITGVKGSAETSYRTGNVNITAANIGLGNVENKSSETIRGELTKANVTTALGYTPPTTNTTYEEATTSKAGLMSTAMVTKLNGIETGAQVNTITGVKGNSESTYRTGNVNITKANIGLGNVDNTADANKSVKYATSAGSATKASQDANGTDIRANYLRKSSDYLNTHPENSGTIIPFINNDIAFLTERGGSAKVFYDGVEQEISTANMFDASANYWANNPTGITKVTVELTLHKVFGWTNTIYVDHGSSGWRAKNVKIETINTNYADDVWVTRYENTAQGKGNYFTTFAHQAVGSTSGASGFNKIRFTFSDWANATIFRIAQLGVLSYGSIGLRETSMSRGIDDGVLRNITPNTDGKYSLGSISKKWNGHFKRITLYGSAAENPLITRGIVGSDGNGNIGELHLQYGANSPIKLGNAAAHSISADGSQYSGNAATATNASKVNGLTVQTAVPANAKFTDTTYTGENGVTVSGTKISNSGVRSISTGSTNGTISVNTNGTSANVAVKGLANAAYKGVDTTIGAASTSTNLPTSAAVASFVEGKGYKTTDNNTTYTFATGDANGQIKVTPSGGSAQNVSVKGLGSLAYKSSLAASDVGAIASTLKGAASGVAELDANGKVPSSQLPSYVDDTIEGYLYNSKFYKESAHTTQITGETGKIYVDLSTNKTYRWSGSAFVEISASLALGTTSSTAYRGDYGNTAYTHATDSSKLTTATSSGLYKVASTAKGHIASLTAVTKADITGLGIPGSDTNTTYTFATGDSNGQIKVTPSGGTASNISVKGLAAGAYKGVDTSIAAASTSTNLPTSKAVAAFVEGKGYKTTDNNTTYTFATGSSNGTISVTPSGGSAQSVTVKGLAAAAYKGVDTSLASGSTSTNLPTSKAVADLVKSEIGNASSGVSPSDLLDLIYPVGSIYMSVVDVSPSTFLGGTWERLKDRFLLGAGDTYTAGATGGSATKTIAKANLPNYNLYSASHTHTFTGSSSSFSGSGNLKRGDYTVVAADANGGPTWRYILKGGTGLSTYSDFYSISVSGSVTAKGTNSGTTITVSSGGSGTALDVMNPYLTVYMWKRT